MITVNGVRFTGRPALNPDQYEYRKRTDFIVVHCADTPAHLDIGVKEIRAWHKAKGWLDVGYHFVIRRDGTVEYGRPLKAIGSHVAGKNSESVAICLVGGKGPNGTAENNFTPQQFLALETVIRGLKTIENAPFPEAEVLGHRDFAGVLKQCPSFDTKAWWAKEEATALIPLTDWSLMGQALLVA